MMHARPMTPHTERHFVPEYERSEYDVARLGWAIQHARCGKFNRLDMAKACGLTENQYRAYELEQRPWKLDVAQRMFRKCGYEFRIVDDNGLDISLLDPAKAVKALIYRSGLSKTAFAAKAGISDTALTTLLTARSISVKTLSKVAQSYSAKLILRKNRQTFYD